MKLTKQKPIKQIEETVKNIIVIAGTLKGKTKVKSVLKARIEIHKHYSRI